MLGKIEKECDSEIFLKAMRIAQEYKHCQQQLSKKDLGETPIIEWFKECWGYWYRDRWIEHMCGREYWREFGESSYNIINKENAEIDKETLYKIIEKLKKHRNNISENLGIIFEAVDVNDEDNINKVIKILNKININNNRSPFIEEDKIKMVFYALEEADKYKYIMSEKEGKDLGDKAIIEWFILFGDDWFNSKD